MASHIASEHWSGGRIVELGAGTGPVTAALIERGVPRDRLFVVEKMPALADDLRHRFPGVSILCCGAEEVGAAIGDGDPVTAVISSLPFRSLPDELCREISGEIGRVLAPGGIYVQFTYALIGDLPYAPSSFEKVRTRYTFLNIPPAKVMVYRKPA